MSSKKNSNNKRKHSVSSSNDSDSSLLGTPVPKHSSKHSTPAQSPRKIVKRESTDSDDTDDEGVQIKGKAPLISPFEAMKHLEKIKEKSGDKKPEPSMKHAIATYCAEFKKEEEGKEVQASLTKYLHLAIQPAKLPFNTGSTMMDDFLKGANSLKFIPGFPRPPKNQLFCYAALNDIDSGLGMLKEAADRMKNDEKGKAKAEKEAAKQRATYIENLQAFLAANEAQLTDPQKKSINQTLTRIDKALHPEKYVREKKEKGAPKKKKKEEPKTAFQHFVALSSTLYVELEPEKRLRKLQKKFDKLEDSVREVYDKLALQG